MPNKTEASSARIKSVRDTAKYLGGSRSWLYDQLKRDASFPRPITMSPGRVGFIVDELDAWIEARAAERVA